MPMSVSSMYIGAPQQIASGAVPFKKLADTTLTAKATNVAITGLDSATSDVFCIVVRTTNAEAAGEMRLFINGDTTVTNYRAQYSNASGVAWTVATYNKPYLMTMSQNYENLVILWVSKAPSGKAHIIAQGCNSLIADASDVAAAYTAVKWNSNAPITSLTFSTDVANAYGIGSRFTVYEVRP